MADRSGTSPSTVKHFSGRALIVLLTLIVIKGLKTASRLWVTSCAKVATHLFISDKRATNVWTAVKSALCVHSATTTSPPSPCLRCVRFSSRSAALTFCGEAEEEPPGLLPPPFRWAESIGFVWPKKSVCVHWPWVWLCMWMWAKVHEKGAFWQGEEDSDEHAVLPRWKIPAKGVVTPTALRQYVGAAATRRGRLLTYHRQHRKHEGRCSTNSCTDKPR